MRAGADVAAPKLWTPHLYQNTAVQFLHERTTLNPDGYGGAALFLDPGLGKTSITLEYLSQLKQFGVANRTLIVAPLRVVYQVWPAEIQGWTNFRSLSYSIVHGSPGVRRKRLATQSNIHIINRDAVDWLAKQLKGRKQLPWQTIIVDESTSFKNYSAKRSKAMREICERIPYRVILTGTPAPRNLADLYPQVHMLDQGAALGANITRFRERYCVQVGSREMNNYQVRTEMHSSIHDSIKHLVLRLDAKDYLSMPPITYHDVPVELPPAARAQYDDMEKQMFMELQDGSERGAVNAGAKYNACRQIANGGIYGHDRTIHHLHDAKTEAYVDLLNELGGKPVFAAYQFEHDVQRMSKAVKGLHIIRGGTKDSYVTELITAWNNDTLEPPYLAVQPQAMSYGINAQHGSCRDIVWYGPTDNLDTYLQFNARIYRQGVGGPVRVHRLYVKDTIDEVIWSRIDDKEDVQSKLLDVLRDYAKQKMGKG
jgi:SNF2 family DNA or RNA helicase